MYHVQMLNCNPRKKEARRTMTRLLEGDYVRNVSAKSGMSYVG